MSRLLAAHPFSVLAAPSQLAHPSISLPQLPISRWPAVLYVVCGVNFSDVYCQSGSLTLPHLTHPVAAGTSVICFQYPVGFLSVRLLSLTLSKDNRLPSEKCSASMPSREGFFFLSYLREDPFFHLLDGETSHHSHKVFKWYGCNMSSNTKKKGVLKHYYSKTSALFLYQ